MRHDTQSVEIDVPPKDAFEFVAQPENLPRWAAGFAKAIRRARRRRVGGDDPAGRG